MKLCDECGTDHDGYPPGTFGAAVRCIRARAEQLGAGHLVDQVDALESDRVNRIAAALTPRED